MTATVAKLLAQKEELLRRLDEDNPGPNERAAIESDGAKIDTALNLLNDTVPVTPNRCAIFTASPPTKPRLSRCFAS